MKNRAFWHALHGRGETAQTLAEAICSGRSHLTQVLNGSRPGKPTRRKLIAKGLLSPEEIEVLGWEVPHGALSHVGHSEKAVPVEPAPAQRKAFHVGEMAVSIVPRADGFAFEVFDRVAGIVASEEGFASIGAAESEARKAATAQILKKDTE